MAKNYYKQTAADIISRLPLHHQLNASQAMLVKLTPTWQSWASRQLIQHHQNNSYSNCNSETHFTDAQLVSAVGGKLIIACTNSACASRIKHLQQNLLETFKSQGHREIKQIVVRIQHNLPHGLNESEKHQANSKEKPQAATNLETGNRVTSNNSLKAIQQCQKMVVNDQLAHSLKKLSKTLKDTRK